MYKEIVEFLNKLPNQRIDNGKGMSTYELISKIEKFNLANGEHQSNSDNTVPKTRDSKGVQTDKEQPKL